MQVYLKLDEWNIIEEGFNAEKQRVSESIFSLGNGKMGQRGNFEEHYSGDSLQGNYIAGIYYPDRTRVGWWKTGYPEYYAKVLNAPDWIGIDIMINGEMLDLAKNRVENFKRVLNMREGYLLRTCRLILSNGNALRLDVMRFLSMAEDEAGAIRYSIKPENFKAEITLMPYINADIKNEDANYGEKFWEEYERKYLPQGACLKVKTKKLDFHVCTAMKYYVKHNNLNPKHNEEIIERDKYLSYKFKLKCNPGEEIVCYKYGVVLSSLYHPETNLIEKAEKLLLKITDKGFYSMLEEHKNAWKKIWEEGDIIIEGDVAAQQAIRFNIFHLNQTYTGKDPRLNIGPKGFTGEKYGGSTYWDTEAYCLPFFMCTAGKKVAENLLLYRYRHLPKAIENGSKLGFSNGAALFPMVTMNGEECHNEWEITFEEIHRNSAIAFAIFNYVRYTGDTAYYVKGGLEVLIAISRFWKQRVNFSIEKKKYVILGVTGPNEYENNVNNNWYTNTMASWCLEYCTEIIEFVKNHDSEMYHAIIEKTGFDSKRELADWKVIIDNMYYPFDHNTGIFLQQDGYMDKEQILVKDIDKTQLPLNQKWSWDRILRSCFIKQADVLQGLYFLEHRFERETIKRNFDFYEPRTVHESSLSPCVHSVLASLTGKIEKAYELYLRTARLDLDDYNNEAAEGLHITSMAGTWISIVEGFGGMRVKDNKLHFNPIIPEKWRSYSFTISFWNNLLRVTCSKKQIKIKNISDNSISVVIMNKEFIIDKELTVTI